MAFLEPSHPAEVVDIIRAHAADRRKLAIQGQGTKIGLGRPVTADNTLSLRGLSGIVSYEPEELVLTAKCGTPLAEITEALAAKRQHLAFEPIASASLFGPSNEGGSIGGVLAANLSGPRRPSAGAARDHFLGFTAVNGLGEEFKAGGKVVKNVTGYDLPKLLAGSMGTLAALTEVTVKVLPAPEKQRTVLIPVADAAAGHGRMIALLQDAFEIDGAAFLPTSVAARSSVDLVRAPGSALIALRLSGAPGSCADRCGGIRQLLGVPSEELHSTRSRTLWAEIRDVAALLPDEGCLWRVSVPPSAGAKIATSLATGDDWLMDWGGGLLWIARTESSAADAAQVRAALVECGGHATLVRGPEILRREIDVFARDVPPALLRRVKEAFDPHGILNPGRMYRDW
ncbi:MAG TPA: glycolate oxidase subunit GlcE [Dongiaceae bacterium]|nr:glycolate oxidase subunit GlcE [Dongiaceae bacterium]